MGGMPDGWRPAYILTKQPPDQVGLSESDDLDAGGQGLGADNELIFNKNKQTVTFFEYFAYICVAVLHLS
jgi:hypothetical protein